MKNVFLECIVASSTPVAPLGLGFVGLWRFYTPSAPLGLLKAGAPCAPYKCTFQTGSYNFFVVPRNLPATMMIRTCLKTLSAIR